jgi:hypothetical protein
MNDHVKRTGPAVEAHYQFLMWLIPTVDRFPKSQKFVLGDRILKLAHDVLEILVEATFTILMLIPQNCWFSGLDWSIGCVLFSE